MIRHLFPLVTLVALLAFSACASTRTGPLKLYAHNDGDLINLDVGETMQVVLDGTPTTDVHWLRDDATEAILAQVGTTEFKPDPRLPDARQRLHLSFRAQAEGRTRLQLQYRDPNRSGALDERSFEVWVVVKQRS